ncbi:MAG: Maf family protein [Alcanivoracaceae bacterium]
MTTEHPPLVLASSSPFRRELLTRLGLTFLCDSPDIDESRQPGEAPAQLVQRLALEKARAVASRHPGTLIIGSDQVAVLADGSVLGKPGSAEKAAEQLARASGSTVTFLTGLCLYNAASGNHQLCCEPFRVHFRELTAKAIASYIKKEQPFACAGSFKSEGLGITLFRRLEGDDPNALIGLPLIRLTDMLSGEGIALP